MLNLNCKTPDMKKLVLSALMLAAFVTYATAQDSARIQKQERRHFKGSHRADKHDRKEKMMADMDLTEAQKSELQANRQEMKAKMEAIEKDASLTQAQKSEQKQALKKDIKSQNKQILTPEQQAKMQAAKKARHEQKRDRKRLADMKDELSLSDEQVTQLKALDISQHAKMKAIRNNSKMDQAEKTKQMEALRKSTHERQRSILSREQVKKLEEMRKGKRRQIS